MDKPRHVHVCMMTQIRACFDAPEPRTKTVLNQRLDFVQGAPSVQMKEMPPAFFVDMDSDDEDLLTGACSSMPVNTGFFCVCACCMCWWVDGCWWARACAHVCSYSEALTITCPCMSVHTCLLCVFIKRGRLYRICMHTGIYIHTYILCCCRYGHDGEKLLACQYMPVCICSFRMHAYSFYTHMYEFICPKEDFQADKMFLRGRQKFCMMCVNAYIHEYTYAYVNTCAIHIENELGADESFQHMKKNDNGTCLIYHIRMETCLHASCILKRCLKLTRVPWQTSKNGYGIWSVHCIARMSIILRRQNSKIVSVIRNKEGTEINRMMWRRYVFAESLWGIHHCALMSRYFFPAKLRLYVCATLFVRLCVYV